MGVGGGSSTWPFSNIFWTNVRNYSFFDGSFSKDLRREWRRFMACLRLLGSRRLLARKGNGATQLLSSPRQTSDSIILRNALSSVGKASFSSSSFLSNTVVPKFGSCVTISLTCTLLGHGSGIDVRPFCKTLDLNTFTEPGLWAVLRHVLPTITHPRSSLWACGSLLGPLSIL